MLHVFLKQIKTVIRINIFNTIIVFKLMSTYVIIDFCKLFT